MHSTPLERGRLQKFVITAGSATMLCVSSHTFAQLRAFPEAEGFGAGASGGRGGTVYHVTNLNDAGAGSFRDAVSAGSRTVVFDVGGWIELASPVSVQDNITIAGQTAPGQGIGLKNYGVSFSNADNVIARHLRIRQGPYVDSVGRDAVGATGANNVIFDHISSSWGRDENFSITSSSNITIQNSMVAEGLLNHSMGGLIEWNEGISIHHSLYVANNDRNPKTKGILDFVNNVVFNWGAFAYVAGDSAGLSYGNVVGNYFIAGPASSELHDPISRGNANYSIYMEGNYYDGNLNAAHDGVPLTQASVDDVLTWMPTRFDYPHITTDSAVAAYDRVLRNVGANLSRDSVDTRLVNNVINRTGELINDPASVGGWGTLAGGTALTDTDQDGMPDAWETVRGLNPGDAADRNSVNLFGYTRLEEYVNELGGAHPAKIWNASGGTWDQGSSWIATGTPTIDDTIYVRGKGAGTTGQLTIDSPGAQAWDVRIGGNGDVSGETLTVTAGGVLAARNTIMVGYQNKGMLHMIGGSVDASHVVLGSFGHSGDLILDGGVLRTSVILQDGIGGAITMNGGTIAASGTLVINAPIMLNSNGGTIDTGGHSATIQSVIAGSELRKTGTGDLQLTNNNTQATTVLVGGTLSIVSHANLGGNASALRFEGGVLRVLGTGMGNISTHSVNWSTFNGGFDIDDASNTFVVSSSIEGAGAVTKAGAGTMVLQSGSSTYSGGTTISGGVLSVANDQMLGNVSGKANLSGGTLRYTNPLSISTSRSFTLAGNSGIDLPSADTTLTINSPIAGDGSLNKLGAGTLILSASNTYRGTTTISAGSLRITNANALQNSTVNLAGGTLDLNGLAASVGGLAGTGVVDIKNQILTLGGSNQDSTFAGNIINSSGIGSVVKVGTGTINLTGTNTYQGGTTLQSGALGITTDANIGQLANSPVTFSGGLLRINGTALTSLGSHVVNYSSFDGGFDINSPTHTFTISANISGSGAMIKRGEGTLLLGGINTYNGGTILQAGTLSISSHNNIGNNQPLTFAGGLLRTVGTNITDLNSRTVNWSSFNGGFDVSTSGTILSVSQVIGGNGGLIKRGAGILNLSAANTFTGDTTLSAGVIRLSNVNALANSTLTPAGGSIALNSISSANLGGLKGSGALSIAGLTLNVGSNNQDTTYTGVLGGTGTINKVGTGTLTLGGASSTPSTLAIKAGTISVTSVAASGSNSPLGSGSVLAVLDGGRLIYNSGSSGTTNRSFTLTQNGGAIECAGAGLLTLSGTGIVGQSGTGDRTLTLAGVNADCGFAFQLGDPTSGKTTLRKEDGGRWIMNGAAGSLTYSGDTIIDSGILIINGNVRLPTGTGKGNLIINAGQFEMNGRDMSINGLYGAGNIQNRTSTKTLTLGNNNADGDFSGVVSNTGGGGSTQLLNVNKIGSGTQIFSGFNTYGGVTNVLAGKLVLGSHLASGFSSILVSGGTLEISPGADRALRVYKTFVIAGGPAPTAKADLTDSAMVLSKSSGNVLADLNTWVLSGYAGGTWTGNGITSVLAATDDAFGIAVIDNAALGLLSYHGLTTTSDSLIVTVTHCGDSNLDRSVDFADLLILAQNYGSTASTWLQGDFNYDGSTGFDDLLKLAQNYGSQASFQADWARAVALAPEPSLLGLLATCLIRRRRASR